MQGDLPETGIGLPPMDQPKGQSTTGRIRDLLFGGIAFRSIGVAVLSRGKIDGIATAVEDLCDRIREASATTDTTKRELNEARRTLHSERHAHAETAAQADRWRSAVSAFANIDPARHDTVWVQKVALGVLATGDPLEVADAAAHHATELRSTITDLESEIATLRVVSGGDSGQATDWLAEIYSQCPVMWVLLTAATPLTNQEIAQQSRLDNQAALDILQPLARAGLAKTVGSDRGVNLWAAASASTRPPPIEVDENDITMKAVLAAGASVG